MPESSWMMVALFAQDEFLTVLKLPECSSRRALDQAVAGRERGAELQEPLDLTPELDRSC